MKKFISVLLTLSTLLVTSFSANAATIDGLIYKNSLTEEAVDMYPGNVTVEANVTGEEGDTTAQLISAVYNGDELIAVGLSDVKDISSKTQKFSAELDVDTIDGAVVKNFIWKNTEAIEPITAVQSVLINLEVINKPGYQVLNWTTTADETGHTYRVMKDGAILADNLAYTKHAYVDKSQSTEASVYQVVALLNGEQVGASNKVTNTPIMFDEVSLPSASGEWGFNTNGTITTANGYKYTDSQLRIADNGKWKLSTGEKWYNNTSLVDKNFGENVIVSQRADDNYFVVCFGNDIRSKQTVNVSFDFWGTWRWQNIRIDYTDASGTIHKNETPSVQVQLNDWKNYSYQMNTNFDLTDYGYPGQYGFVLVYPGSGDEQMWIKNLKVSTLGKQVGITANSAGTGYSELLPSGPELTETNGNTISGNVLVKDKYGAGYAYRQVDGQDAFYLTQLYNTASSKALAVNCCYLNFKVDTDKFAKNPNSVSGLYLITEYYDGTAGDILTTPFKISYTTNRYGWDNTTATTVTMSGDNQWKTNVTQLTGNLFLGTDLPNGFDSASISYSIPNANDGYNKKGILIRKVILCDEAYKNYYTSDAYTQAVAAYEKYQKDLEKLNKVGVAYPDGVGINFNKSGADATPDIEYWSDIETNGIALRCDSVNDEQDNSYRGILYGQYGPENDKRWAVSTASYWGKRAESKRMSYMYFKVDESYINADPQDVEVEITYYDYAGGNVKDRNRIEVLSKVVGSGTSKVGTYYAQSNTGTWKTATIRLSDAIFDKSDEGYGDFRLTLETSQSDVKQLIISDIKVRNITAKTQDERKVAKIPTVYIAGDSIAAEYALSEFGREEYANRYGWGEKLDFGEVSVVNRAVPGQSTKNFNFDGIYSRLKKGDYVLISFGHNDSTQNNDTIYVTVDQYKSNLKNIINTVISKGATPVLITSIPTYNPETYVVNTDDGIDPYRVAAMQVASDCGILGIDLYSAFKAELERLPNETAKSYYQNENDAEWHKRIHLMEPGAACVAELIENALKNSSKIVELKNYIN